MFRNRAQPRDFLFAFISGALLALSFPRYGHPASAWIALVPLLIALSGWNGAERRLPAQPSLRAFALGLTTGVVYFVGTIYWTGTVVAVFGGLAAPVALLAMLLLALYLALYPAIAALITNTLVRRTGHRAFLLVPAVWVATEYLRGVLFGGFPWVPLGNSQVALVPIAQLASVFGVYGVSALVAFVNGGLAFAVLSRPRARMQIIAVMSVVLLTVAVGGAWRVSEGSLMRQGTPIRVGLIQGNIDQRAKWDPREARRIFTTYLAMTRDAVRRGAEYVIWPESSTPFIFQEDQAGAQAIRDLVADVRVPLLFGSEQLVRGDVPRLYNSAFLVTPSGTTAVYRKIQLVPFGEFIPLQQWLTFLSPLVEAVAEFASGDEVTMLPVGSHLTSTAICYEVVFPWLARRAVERGSELLTTITNDAWYGESSAPFQHFALASMRAIEQGRYLARAANTGISGVVDPYGRVVRASGIFEQVGLVEEVRFLSGRTVYSRIGDVVPYTAMALTVAALIALRRR